MQSALTEAISALAKAQDDYDRYYNRRREPAPEYTPGTGYILMAVIFRHPDHQEARTPLLGSLCGGMSCRTLCLPPPTAQSMSRLHPVFPVVKLMPAPADPIPGRQSDPPPDPSWSMERNIMKLKLSLIAAYSRDNSSTSSSGKVTAMNTIAGRTLQMYVLQH